MKKITLTALIAAIAICALTVPSFTEDKKSDQSHRDAALTLMKTLKAENIVNTLPNQYTMNVLRQNPKLRPFAQVLVQFFKDNVTWEKTKEFYVKAYTDTYTKEELQQVNKFFTSKVGNKWLTNQMEVMKKYHGAIGQLLQTKEMQDKLKQAITAAQTGAPGAGAGGNMGNGGLGGFGQ